MQKLHHVGILVNDIEAALKTYSKMPGISPLYDIRDLPEFGVRSVVLATEDTLSYRVELLSPMKEDAETRYQKEARAFLNSKGEGLFYFNIFTDQFDEDVKAAEDQGFHIIVETYKTLFPGYSVRMGFYQPHETHGAWFNLVDIYSVPKSRGGLAP